MPVLRRTSWNPIRLVAGANGITYGAIGIVILLHVLMIILLGFAIRLIRRKISARR
ncbi:MAG: hypothetical protein ACYC5X_05095 [Syntrophales bacterium]